VLNGELLPLFPWALLQISLFVYTVMMKIMLKGLRFPAVFFFLIIALISCKKPATEMDGIKSRGVLRVGVKADVPGFGFLNPESGLYEGLEIELARLIASDLLGDSGNVEFTEVVTLTKAPSLERGIVDLVIATYTITEERKASFNFSSPYYTDALGFMVRKDSNLKGLADMDGKTFGVVSGATSRAALEAVGGRVGLGFEILEFPGYPETKDALTLGIVDVFVADKSILYGYGDENSQILPDAFAPQPYGIACVKSSGVLASYVNSLVTAWQKDGTIDRLAKQMALF
jgi:putative glutamine transport system substrate-binding protein